MFVCQFTKSIGAPYTQVVLHTRALRNRCNMILHKISTLFYFTSVFHNRAEKVRRNGSSSKEQVRKHQARASWAIKIELASKNI